MENEIKIEMTNYFDNTEYLIFSSHKTATQSLSKTLNHHNLTTIHFHICKDLLERHVFYEWSDNSIQQKYILSHIKQYCIQNKKRLKIISIIRNPHDRLIASFFQRLHNGEIIHENKNEKHTTIMSCTDTELINRYNYMIKNDRLMGRFESLDQISSMFETDIIKELKFKDDYYYYENKWIELYVLDFNRVINDTLEYVNKILKLNLRENIITNLSNKKIYYEKYLRIKEIVKKDKELYGIVKDKYNPFYFQAFEKNIK